MSALDGPFDRLADDGEVREGAEALADRDGTIGAMARIALALADGNQPDPEDCEVAGLETLRENVTGGDN